MSEKNKNNVESPRSKSGYVPPIEEDSMPGYVEEAAYSQDMTDGSSAFNLSSYENKTIDDLLALPDDVHMELIDGTFYEMAEPTTYHQIIAGELFGLLRDHINTNKGRCMAFMSNTGVQLDRDDKTMVEPDVCVICDRDQIIKSWLVGAPDLVIEVVSPSNWRHDVFRKLKKYRNAGVREYWLVMPEQKEVQVYFFEKSDLPTGYSFSDRIPVNIWEGKCMINFADIYEKVAFLIG